MVHQGMLFFKRWPLMIGGATVEIAAFTALKS